MASAPSIALVANRKSGSGGADAVVDRLRGAGADVRAFDLDQLAEAVESGRDRLAIAGGDGSIAPAASRAGKEGMPIAVIPIGTANDFASAAGLPEAVDAACRTALFGSRTRPVDIGWVGERPFVNAVSVGLSPKAARRAAGLKGRLGPLAYFVGALGAGLRAQPVECAVSCDGERLFSGSAWQAILARSGAFGAGSSVRGSLDDGRLHVVAVPAGPRPFLLWRAYGMRRAAVEGQRDVRVSDCREAELEVGPGTDLNVDGEIVESGAVGLRVEPGAFELVVG